MNSRITIYRTQITPQRNALVDDIANYLAHDCVRTYDNPTFQYIKLGLDIPGIKIPMDQSRLSQQSVGNYCRIEQDGKVWYYFILNAKWRGQNVIELDLSIDSINTFRDNVEWSDKTIIQRQHADRLQRIGTTNSFLRKIDRENEGIVSTKIDNGFGYTSIQETEKKNRQNFYLIYRTRDNLTPDNISNPISCFLASDNPLLIRAGGGSGNLYRLTPSSLESSKGYYVKATDSPIGEVISGDQKYRIGGDKRVFRIYLRENKLYCDVYDYKPAPGGYWTFESINTFLNGVDYIDLNNVNKLFYAPDNEQPTAVADIEAFNKYLLIESGTLHALYSATINDIDRTDSRIIKIIKLPYAPCNINYNADDTINLPNNWEFDKEQRLMRLKTDLSTEFLNENLGDVELKELILTESESPTALSSRQNKRESKLYHSDFYTLKLAYDNFAKTIALENISCATFVPPASWTAIHIPTYEIAFKPTNTINSKFAFGFKLKNFREGTGSFPTLINFFERKTADYEDYLLITRNNEMPIYSNDYVNYIRNGYNYDKKAHSLQMWNNGVNAAGGIIGGAAGAVGVGKAIKPIAGIAAGIASATKAIGSVAGVVIDQLQFENQMNGKLQQLSSQASVVSGSDDVDLLEYYNKNRLQKIVYESEPHTKDLLADLFFYTGYVHNHREMPNTTSRYWFNFIQCEPVFKDESLNPFADYIEDIKARYRKGVTVYHAHRNLTQHYDWEQEHENWETSILEA